MQSIVDQNERMNDFPHTHTYMYSRIYRNKIYILLYVCMCVVCQEKQQKDIEVSKNR